MKVTELMKEAKALGIRGYSTLNKAPLLEVIHKAKYKDVSMQTDCKPYCKPCTLLAWQKNLEQYSRELAERQRRVIHDGELVIDPDTGEVLEIV